MGAQTDLRFDDGLNALEMRRDCLARSRSTSPLACRSRLQFSLVRAEPGLDLVEGEGLLVGIELLEAAAEAGRSSCLMIA